MDGFRKAGVFFQKFFGSQNQSKSPPSSRRFDDSNNHNDKSSFSPPFSLNHRRHTLHVTSDITTTTTTKPYRISKNKSTTTPRRNIKDNPTTTTTPCKSITNKSRRRSRIDNNERMTEELSQSFDDVLVIESHFCNFKSNALKHKEVLNSNTKVENTKSNKLNYKEGENKKRDCGHRRSRSEHGGCKGGVVVREAGRRCSEDKIKNQRVVNTYSKQDTTAKTSKAISARGRYRKRDNKKIFSNNSKIPPPSQNTFSHLPKPPLPPLDFPTTPETLLEHHQRHPLLDANEEWLVVELNEYECLIDGLDVIKVIANHSKFFEVEPAELWSEFFEFVEVITSYDEVINLDIWQEFRDKRYTC